MPIKTVAQEDVDDLRPEYDLSKLTGGIRGKYYERATAGTTHVLLEQDVAEAFPDGRTVNEALRALIKVAHRRVPGARSGGKAPQSSNRARKPTVKSRKRSRAARG